MSGYPINVFTKLDKFPHGTKVAMFVYAVDRHGKVWHGLVRKDPCGAAGTQEVYYGKWGSTGGQPSSRAKHVLDALCTEFSDETGHDVYYKQVELDFHSPVIRLPYTPNLTQRALYLRYCAIHHKVIIAIAEMDYNRFMGVFPVGGVVNKSLKRYSHGEIDASGSFSTGDLIRLQAAEVNHTQNDFLLPYCLDSFKTIMFPFVCMGHDYLGQKHGDNVMAMKKGRHPRKRVPIGL
jgi:hypothetical protein